MVATPVPVLWQAKRLQLFHICAIASVSLGASSLLLSTYGNYFPELSLKSTTSSASTEQAPPPQQTVFDGVKARAFERWDANRPIPCPRPEPDWSSQEVQTSPSATGLLMVKCYKTGSTTAASVQLRIAHNVARAKNKAMSGARSSINAVANATEPAEQYPLCKVRYDHAKASDMGYRVRQTHRVDSTGNGRASTTSEDDSFLWTTVRDPTKRAISEFFFQHVSRQKNEPFDTNFRRYVSVPYVYEHYRAYLSMEPYSTKGLDPAKRRAYDAVVANRILQEYDFVGVTERMDESIVALRLILGLQTRDVLHLATKSAGSYDDGGGKNRCTFIVPSHVSSGMRDFFYNASHPMRWMELVAIETALHRAANASLDMTIDSLGREAFQRALDEFQRAQRAVHSSCAAEDAFPCSSNGGSTARDVCLVADMGCGFGCIDRVADELGLPEYQYRLAQ